MLDWLRKLMAGDQSAVPADAEVSRDADGRVTRVKQTLSLAGDDPAVPAHPQLPPAGSLAPRLAAACDWLAQQNIRLARDWGIGLEQNYDYDQGTGLLGLKFGDGRAITARGQFLGSFDPRDRSFMWSWANSSILPAHSEDAARLKAEGERLGLAALTTPVQSAGFDALTPLLALAAQQGGADGVYRCMLNGTTSVFLSLRIDASAGGGATAASADDAMLAAAHALAAGYDAEMLAIDRDYHEREDEEGIAGVLLDRKRAVYRRYWSRDDDYWEPCSFGWPSDHDPDETKLRFTVPHPGGGALDITIGKLVGRTVYRIGPVGDGLKIIDGLLDWGDGFIWPSMAESDSAC